MTPVLGHTDVNNYGIAGLKKLKKNKISINLRNLSNVLILSAVIYFVKWHKLMKYGFTADIFVASSRLKINDVNC